MSTHFRITLIAVLMFVTPWAHAGIVEDLLASPTIQSLLGRQPELQAAIQKCADARFRQRNASLCQQAEEAARLARVPPELRAVLVSPSSAASIRELCLAVQAGPMQNSYLCAELVKADASFKALVEQRRLAIPPVPQPQPESSRS